MLTHANNLLLIAALLSVGGAVSPRVSDVRAANNDDISYQETLRELCGPRDVNWPLTPLCLSIDNDAATDGEDDPREEQVEVSSKTANKNRLKRIIWLLRASLKLGRQPQKLSLLLQQNVNAGEGGAGGCVDGSGQDESGLHDRREGQPDERDEENGTVRSKWKRSDKGSQEEGGLWHQAKRGPKGGLWSQDKRSPQDSKDSNDHVGPLNSGGDDEVGAQKHLVKRDVDYFMRQDRRKRFNLWSQDKRTPTLHQPAAAAREETPGESLRDKLRRQRSRNLEQTRSRNTDVSARTKAKGSTWSWLNFIKRRSNSFLRQSRRKRNNLWWAQDKRSGDSFLLPSSHFPRESLEKKDNNNKLLRQDKRRDLWAQAKRAAGGAGTDEAIYSPHQPDREPQWDAMWAKRGNIWAQNKRAAGLFPEEDLDKVDYEADELYPDRQVDYLTEDSDPIQERSKRPYSVWSQQKRHLTDEEVFPVGKRSERKSPRCKTWSKIMLYRDENRGDQVNNEIAVLWRTHKRLRTPSQLSELDL